VAEPQPKPALYVAIGAAVAVAIAAFWLPRLWENREYRRAEAIAGVGAPVLSGAVADARRQIGTGMAASRITAALGKPSFSAGTQGSSSHEIWTYYFSDGVLTINLTDGYAVRISTDFGAPRIRTSKRP
jgi:hypothetical protein